MNERECRRGGCTVTRHSDLGMEFHLLRDHDDDLNGGLR